MSISPGKGHFGQNLLHIFLFINWEWVSQSNFKVTVLGRASKALKAGNGVWLQRSPIENRIMVFLLQYPPLRSVLKNSTWLG
jgi:hypothetical protein